MLIYDILKSDHRRVMEILLEIEKVTDADSKKNMITLVHTELAMHSKAEEEVLYRPLKERLTSNDLIDHSFDDHDAIDKLLAKLQFTSAEDKEWNDNLRRLKGILQQHIATEESSIFALAQKQFTPLEAEKIGVRMLEEKGKLGMPNPIMVAARKVKEMVMGD